MGSGGVLATALGTGVLVLGVVIGPVRWARDMITGQRPLRPVAPEFTEPGDVEVVLSTRGPRPIETLMVLRQVVEPDFSRAKAMVESVPTTVAHGLSGASAHRVRLRLEKAGAAVVVRRGPPPER